VDSLRRKYERLVAVLRALHESPQPSEVEIARRLGVSRNQVKYVIERVREEFSRFFPDLAHAAHGRRKRQGAEL
jgi:DNA-directed RNA polymerase sigma subunit (sigma70/sigma32)